MLIEPRRPCDNHSLKQNLTMSGKLTVLLIASIVLAAGIWIIWATWNIAVPIP